MKLKKLLTILLLMGSMKISAQVKHVVLISIDGFHPDMYLNKSWPTPNLQELMKKGTYSDKLISVFPSYTYPSHTAMITGALPARSGIYYNQPIGSTGEWGWFANQIKVPTLWQQLKIAGLMTAAVEWPVSVDAPINWNIPEIWDVKYPDDRITEARKYATPGLVDELEKNVTGKLDSTNFNDNKLSWDVNIGKIGAYIFKTKRPAFLAVHFANVDGREHDEGRDTKGVREAVATDDKAIGLILQAIKDAKQEQNTTVIIVGDHGFSTINQIMRPNMLIKSLPVRFLPAGGSAFLYNIVSKSEMNKEQRIKAATDSLDQLPEYQRKLFRIINRPELDRMGADSSVLMAIAAQPGLVFSGATNPKQVENHGPGTLIQQSKFEGLFIPTTGGHHGYDPKIPDMWTGFIAQGSNIIKGGHINEISEPDITVLIVRLLGISFQTPDGKTVPGILKK